MTTKKACVLAGLVSVACAVGLTWFLIASFLSPVGKERNPDAVAERNVSAAGDVPHSPDARPNGEGVQQAVHDAEAEPVTAEPPLSESEKAEAAGEAKVDAFDSLTDRWMEPTKSGVTMKDVDGFTTAFRAVPKDRKDECIHRALNLIPDENVMLLAGILMDKSEDKEIVETVFNDVLNRDEEVKKPILKQIFADKAHPCWADTAWILDVTGELPSKK